MSDAPQAEALEAGSQASGRRTQKVVVFCLWVGVIAGYQLWAYARGTSQKDAAVDFVAILQGSAWGPIAIAVAYLIRPLLLLSAALLTVAAGFLFGVGVGLVVVVLASNASAMVAYAVGRWFAGDRIPGAARSQRLGAYVARMRTRSFETTMTLRLLFLPYDLVSYAAGFWRIHPWGFLAGTAIGSIPGTVAFVLFGASVEEFDGGLPSLNPITVGVAVGMLAISLVLARLVRRREGQA